LEAEVIELRDKETHELLGTISEDELQVLIDNLEETSAGDTDYYIDQDTIDLLAEEGAPGPLVEFLRRALGGREGVEIRWSRH
jgi:processive 1,2-diacylglycerol beta-glucosyltransferase